MKLTAPRIVDGGRLPFHPIDLIDPLVGHSTSSKASSRKNNGRHPQKHNGRPNEKDRGAERVLGSNDEDFASYLVDEDGNEYEPYSLAWRYLGMYIDCGEDNEKNADNDEGGSDDNGCERLLLWAAYHDPGYSEGQIGEYQFYDLSTGKWDKSSCKTGRCAKMDCHERGTHFELVGVFKEADGLIDWAEQLFKHEGYCIWDSDTYESMQNQYDRWRTECTQLVYSEEDTGNSLYVNIQPEAAGNIAMGIYVDEQCTTQSSTVTFADYIHLYFTNYYGDEEQGRQGAAHWASLFDDWNTNMGIYKICQPCRAYNLQAQSDDDDGSGSGSGDGRRFLGNDDGGGDDEINGFDCEDDAGYTNVNQCYKFETKTDMEPAETEDLVRASKQGTILEIRVGNRVYGKGRFPKSGLFSPANAVLAMVGLSILAAGFFLWKKGFFGKQAKIGALPASFQEALFDNDKDPEEEVRPTNKDQQEEVRPTNKDRQEEVRPASEMSTSKLDPSSKADDSPSSENKAERTDSQCSTSDEQVDSDAVLAKPP